MMLTISFSYLFAAVCFLSIPAQTFVITPQSDQLTDAFKELNIYLAKTVRSEDPKANLDEVTNGHDLPDNIVEAAKLFSSLRNTVDDKCDSTNQLILSENVRATRGKALDSDLKNLNRVEWIVNVFCSNHAKRCQPVYRSKFELVYQRMDVEQKERVKVLLDQIIVMHYFHKIRIFGDKRIMRLFNDMIMTELPIRGINSARTLFIALDDLSLNDPDSRYLTHVVDQDAGKKIINKDKINELFVKYMLDPCKYYVDHLTSVFEPARFDAQFHHDIQFEDYVFYNSWAGYRMCQSLLSSDLKKLVGGLVQTAEISS